MIVTDLERIFDYNYWANAKLMAVVTTLTPAQFTESVAGSYGSVRNTLVHTMSAEWGWLERCGGTPRGPALKAEAFPSVEALTATWSEVERYVRAFLGGLRDDDLARVVEFTSPSGATHAMRIGDLMQHTANHATHHRGQVALLLRVLGVAPGNFDLLFYDADRDKPFVW